VKQKIKYTNCLYLSAVCVCLFLLQTATLYAQDSTAVATAAPVKAKPVKNTFQSTWIIDDQTVMVPAKGTLQFDIMHRFGTIGNGYQDLDGLFAPPSITSI